MRRSRLRALVVVALATSVVAMVAAAPALATQPIETFEVSTSSTQAGGHPDLQTKFTLGDPGEPEAAENVIVNLPTGTVRQPARDQHLHLGRLRSRGMPDLLAGGCDHRARQLQRRPELPARLGARLRPGAPLQRRDREVRLHRPGPQRADQHPGRGADGGDYGLRMTVSGITQTMPLAAGDITIWGFPAADENDNSRFLKGKVGSPAGCPLNGSALCASNFGASPHHAGIAVEPLTDNPSRCTQQPLKVTLDVQTYQDAGNLSHAESQYPPTTGCEKQTFNPVFNAVLTTGESDAPAGLDMELKAPLFESTATSPSNIRSSTVLLPEGLSINPDAADGQSACTDAEANFDSEAPANCPDNSKIGNFEIGTPALTGPLTGSLYFGEPKPGDQYRVFMIADGFGIHSKLFASVHPSADTGQLTITVNDLPQVPFDSFELHLFSSQRGLVATPIRCGIYGAVGALRALELGARGADLAAESERRPRPERAALSRPDQALLTEARRRHADPDRGCLQRLLAAARSRRRRSVPRRPQLQDAPRLHRIPARDQLLPGVGDRPRGRQRGARRAGAAELSGVESDRDLERGGGAGNAPVPRRWPHLHGGPVQGRPAVPGRDHAGAGRPLRLRDAGRARRAPRRSDHGSGEGRLRHGAPDHRRRAVAPALDPGRHRSPQLRDQPDELRLHFRSTRRGSATRAPSPTSPRTSTL